KMFRNAAFSPDAKTDAKEVVGPEAAEREYPGWAMPKGWFGSSTEEPEKACLELTEPRDLQLTFSEVDGVTAFKLESAKGQLPHLTVVPATTSGPGGLASPTRAATSSEQGADVPQ